MLDMTNVPLHLTTPLAVDTNIDYTLDLSKFPGLNDPDTMHLLALLPSVSPDSATGVPKYCSMCGNLIPYNTDDTVACGFCVYYGLLDSDDDEEESTSELFSLIASCDIDTDDKSSSSTHFQSVLEDIISSTNVSPPTTSDELVISELSPLPKLSPLTSPDLESIFVTSEANTSEVNTSEVNSASILDREVPNVDQSDITFHTDFIDTPCGLRDWDYTNVMFSPAVHDISSRKRKLSTNPDDKPNKRKKTLDNMDDILMTCFGDFGYLNAVSASDSSDRNDIITRFS